MARAHRARFLCAARRLAIAAAPRLFLRLCAPDREELGRIGEELAARHLVARGWRLRGRRVDTPRGEVDLWAERAGLTVCVEVKTSRLSPAAHELLRAAAAHGADPAAALARLRFRPGQRVDGRRLARLARCARYLAAGVGSARVDLVEVLIDPRGRVLALVHTPDLRRPPP